VTTTTLLRATAVAIVAMASGAWTVSVAGIGGLPSPLDAPIFGVVDEETVAADPVAEPSAASASPTRRPRLPKASGPTAEVLRTAPETATTPEGTPDAPDAASVAPTQPDTVAPDRSDEATPKKSKGPGKKQKNPQPDATPTDDAPDHAPDDEPGGLLDGLLDGLAGAVSSRGSD
jgi:hypothetical protein